MTIPAEIITVAQMRGAEAAAMAQGRSGYALMRAAGEAVALQAVGMVPPGARIVVICGPGNNGGDGQVAARALRDGGFAPRVVLLGEARTPDSARAAREWGGPIEHALPPGDAMLIIDALFGAGLNRAPTGTAAAWIEAVNAQSVPVLAVDVPSGLNADTGQAPGPCIQARRTVTFHRLRPGHLLWPGAGCCGALVVADIGLTAATADTWWNGPALWRAAWPQHGADTHKFRRGACLVWSGPELATGAARLSAQAALRTGAGIVTLAGTRDALRIHAAHLTSILLVEAEHPGPLLGDPRLGACIIGPAAGIGDATREAALAMLRSGTPTVLDADALTSFAGDPGTLRDAIRGIAVLTPHEGEFRRLFPAIDQASKLSRARAAARASGATVLLKGPDTVIASPDGRAAISTHGTHWLATAGSGDVLAGIIGGLLAQGMPGFEAAAAAAWLHAEAGRHAGAHLVAEDVLASLRAVLPT